MEPGELAELRVTFIEDSRGRAVVRLPNGSKTTLDYDSLESRGGHAHFVRNADGSGESVFCLDCGWEGCGDTRREAEDQFLTHASEVH
jgi:hypothetical protein